MADEAVVPSLSSTSTGVGARFITADDIQAARTRREEQWRAAYARLGQEPPPQHQEEAYDGRSLAEKLAANRAAKQEEYEERTKLANQFRALTEDETAYLDTLREKREEEERMRKLEDGEELKSYREAVAAKIAAKPPPALPGSTPAAAKPPAPSKPPAPKKEPAKKGSLKGIVVRKKAKPAAGKPAAPQAKAESTSTKESASALKDASALTAKDGATRSADDDGDEPSAKRRKTSAS
ncbi:N-terminal domain of NEFA-interacting nuclear protein NIP30-domain-containing protein [Schizophyllum commune]